MIEQYECRFSQVRNYIEQKDCQIADLSEQTQSLQQANIALQEQEHLLRQQHQEAGDKLELQLLQQQALYQDLLHQHKQNLQSLHG